MKQKNINDSDESFEEEDLATEASSLTHAPSQRTFLSSTKDVLFMSMALITSRGFFILNSYGNSIILNRHNSYNSSDASAAGALINTYGSMVSSSLFAITASNYIKSIPMVVQKNYEEVRENLLRSGLIALVILTPIGELAFYFSEELFEFAMRAPVNDSVIAAKYFKGFMPGLPFSLSSNVIQQSFIGVGMPWLLVPTAFTQAAVSNLIGVAWALNENLTATESASHLGYANSIAAFIAFSVNLLILRCCLNDPYAFFSAKGKDLLKGIWELVKVGVPVFVSVFTETASIFSLAAFVGALRGDNQNERQTHLAILQASAIYVNFTTAGLTAISQSCMALTRTALAQANTQLSNLEEAVLISRASNLIGFCLIGLFSGTLSICYKPATQWLLQSVDLSESDLNSVLYVYLINNLFGQLIDSLRLIGNASLIGHGYFLLPTLINIISMLAVGVSLSYLMGPGLLAIGLLGPFIARQIGISVGAVSTETSLFIARRSLRQTETKAPEDSSIPKQAESNPYSFKFFSQTDKKDDDGDKRCECVLF